MVTLLTESRFGQDPDTHLVEHYRQLLDSRLEYLERLLSRRRYLAGDEVTLADLFCLPYGERMDEVRECGDSFDNCVAIHLTIAGWPEELDGRLIP